jgi:hypothetical protein
MKPHAASCRCCDCVFKRCSHVAACVATPATRSKSAQRRRPLPLARCGLELLWLPPVAQRTSCAHPTDHDTTFSSHSHALLAPPQLLPLLLPDVARRLQRHHPVCRPGAGGVHVLLPPRSRAARQRHKSGQCLDPVPPVPAAVRDFLCYL